MEKDFLKKRIDEIDKEIEQVFNPTIGLLSLRIVELSKEKEELLLLLKENSEEV